MLVDCETLVDGLVVGGHHGTIPGNGHVDGGGQVLANVPLCWASSAPVCSNTGIGNGSCSVGFCC
ncbi:hypothetical protein VKI21_02270 [Cyanobacterium aponinum UTEX 3222]|uniref:hypothetical protein n=1 Tax=Cyanobacterium aponinum TaxID=379064 RepID=UPI0030860AE1|nr:hypothetical protein VKI21_02270 [Cyanobacterium aponinum UTEX 3222]